jgi:hypothetical protein
MTRSLCEACERLKLLKGKCLNHITSILWSKMQIREKRQRSQNDNDINFSFFNNIIKYLLHIGKYD